jgi:hypothetical protein
MGYFTDNEKDGYMSVPINDKQMMVDEITNNDWFSTEIPVKRHSGELIIIAAYVQVGTQSDLKARTKLVEISRMISKSLEDCGKDVRIIILPTTGETKIECIYPK